MSSALKKVHDNGSNRGEARDYEGDYDFLNCLEFEDEFAYPDLYLSLSKNNESYSGGRVTSLNDGFITKLEQLHKLEALTLLEEHVKVRERNKRLSKGRTNSSKGYGFSKIDGKHPVNSTAARNMSAKKEAYPIHNEKISLEVINYAKTSQKQFVGQQKSTKQCSAQNRLTPMAYKVDGELFKCITHSAMKSHKHYAPKMVERAKTSTFLNARYPIRSSSVKTPNSANCINALSRTSLATCKPFHNAEIKKRTKSASSSATRRTTTTTKKFPRYECMKQPKHFTATNILNDEYGEKEEEKAVFAAALPNVQEHYKRYMRDTKN